MFHPRGPHSIIARDDDGAITGGRGPVVGSRGFTLVELLIVLAVLAVLATVAIPLLVRSRITANEEAAVATVRLVLQAQAQFVTLGVADGNGNGTGEYGTFGEMSGNTPIRAAAGGTVFLVPPYVSPAFRTISPLGEMSRGGYCYRIYLPGPGGEGLLEAPGGGASATVDPALAESLWCVYAWPRTYGTTGHRTFFANQAGQILWTEDPLYTGSGAPIAPGAALKPGGPVNEIDGLPAAGEVGRDGRTWRPAGG